MTDLERGSIGTGGWTKRIHVTHKTALLVIVLFTATVLLIFLGTGDPTNTMEMFNLVPVREAWREGHWLIPTLDGLPRFEKPPLCVWIPAALASLAGSDSLWVVRLPSVLMAILTAMGTYGIGCVIFRNRFDGAGTERRYALFAALLVPAMFAFDRHARLASYDIYATAFAVGCAFFTVAMAEGSAGAVGGGRISRGKAGMLMVAAGLCMGASMLAKGPAPVATVLAPLLVWLGIFHRRRGVWLGVAGIFAVGLLAALPWVAAMLIKYPEAWDFWKGEIFRLSTSHDPNAPRVALATRRPWYYYVQILLWVAPFIPLFVAGLALPFLKLRGEVEPSPVEVRGRWMAWIVVVGGLVLLSFPAVKELRYAVQLLPFAALLCAAAGQEFVRARAGVKLDLAPKTVLAVQGGFFILPAAGAIVGAIWMLAGGHFPQWTRGDEIGAAFGGVGLLSAIGMGMVQLAGGLWMWHCYARRRFFAAGGAMVFCAWIFAMGVGLAGRSDAANYTNEWRAGLERAAAVVGRDQLLVALKTDDVPPWLSALYYFDRTVPVVSAAKLEEFSADHPEEPIYVVVIYSRDDAADPAWQELGLIEQLTQRKAVVVARCGEERMIAVARLDVVPRIIGAR